jgi:hypothetical protein
MEKNKFEKVDQNYLENRKIAAKELGIDNLWDIADQFGLYSGTQTIATRLAIYEILKESMDVPGNLVEFGSWKGANLMFMAKVLNILQPNSLKKVFCFEGFEGLKTFDEKDLLDNSTESELTGKYKGDENVLRKMISLYEMDNWVEIVKGNALETIDKFEDENPHMFFSFAYIDFDLYAPVKKALDFLESRMSRGGIIVFDEAMTDIWKGEGIAMKEFLEKNKDYKMKTIGFARQPTIYLVRE